MAKDSLTVEIDGNVAVLHMDDGKANALSHDMIAALSDGLDRAAKDARAALVVGRPGRFSAGFDLSVMSQGPEAVRGLVGAGAELLLKMYEHPQPVVIACTGHALAAGALLLLSADTRIGARGDFKLGLNETAIGMALPEFGVELARDRLSKRHFGAATMQARLYDPDTAIDAGYLDRVCEADVLLGHAHETAAELADLAPAAYAATKKRTRSAVAAVIRSGLADDLNAMTGGPSR